MKNNAVINKYAKAFHLFCTKHSRENYDQIMRDLQYFLTQIKEEKKLYSFIIQKQNPNKADVFNAIKDQYNISVVIFQFCNILCERNVIHLLYGIYDKIVTLYNCANGILNIKAIISNESLKDKVMHKVKEIVNNVNSSDIHFEVKESILGGYILKYNNCIIDRSIQTKIKELNNYLIK